MKLIYNYTFEDLQELLLEKGFKKYRTSQVWDWLYEDVYKRQFQVLSVILRSLFLKM